MLSDISVFNLQKMCKLTKFAKVKIIEIMKLKFSRVLAYLVMLFIAAPSCAATNPSESTFNFSKSGIASVKIGADYRSVPASCPGLYTSTTFFVRCGSEDGEGVDIFYNDEAANKNPNPDCLVCAKLDVDSATFELLEARGLTCCYYSLTDPRITEVLKKSRSTIIDNVTVAPSPSITVTVGGRKMATSEPAVKFMKLPGAVTTVSLGEGLILNCTIGELNMTITNAYEALYPDAESAITKKLDKAMDEGNFEPVEISPADVKPTAKFDYFEYFPQ